MVLKEHVPKLDFLVFNEENVDYRRSENHLNYNFNL